MERKLLGIFSISLHRKDIELTLSILARSHGSTYLHGSVYGIDGSGDMPPMPGPAAGPVSNSGPQGALQGLRDGVQSPGGGFAQHRADFKPFARGHWRQDGTETLRDA